MEVTAVASVDIRSGKGLLIARKGDAGRVFSDPIPNDSFNFGKVAVRWADRRRWYWVDPRLLDFSEPLDRGRFASLQERKIGRGGSAAARFPCFDSDRTADSVHFGRNLRLLREIRGISQSELAKKMGLRQSTISYREGKRRAPGDSFVRRSSEILRVPSFYFLFPVEDVGEYLAARLFLYGASSAFCDAGRTGFGGD